MKLVLGHADLLAKDNRIKHLFNPAPIEEIRERKPYRKFCIYTEAEGYLIQDIIGLQPQREILPIIYWKDNERTSQSLFEEFTRIGYNITKKDILKAIYIADKKSY